MQTHIQTPNDSRKPPLGILAKLPTPPLPPKAKKTLYRKAHAAYLTYKKPDNRLYARLERFIAHAMARASIPLSRTAHCLRTPAKGSRVGIKYSPSCKRASYSGLQTCGSVWACPLCAAKISEQRRKDLIALVAAHRAAGGVVLLSTRTFPHALQDDLDGMLSKLSKAEDLFKSGTPWERLKARFGLIGTVRAIEVTYGPNGWHPHVHELLFLSAEVDQKDLEDALFVRWDSACKRAGFPSPSRAHGLDVRDGEYAAAYASKWGLESELTKGHIKQGRGDSMTPFDFLRIMGQTDDAEAFDACKTLFAIYANAFKGKRQLVYSKGLRELYSMEKELTDEEAAKGEEPDAVLLGLIEPDDWKKIVKRELRGYLLEYMSQCEGDWARFRIFIELVRRDAPLPPLIDLDV